RGKALGVRDPTSRELVFQRAMVCWTFSRAATGQAEVPLTVFSRASTMAATGRSRRPSKTLRTDDQGTRTTFAGLKHSDSRLLHCPYCESSLDLIFETPSTPSSNTEDSVNYGILRCSCARYPVVEGIP